MQLQEWSSRLCDEVRIGSRESNMLATTIASELSQIPEETAQEIRGSSEVSSEDRKEELSAFQTFMDQVNALPDVPPAFVRAQTVLQSYFCFVYVRESYFEALKKLLPSGSTAKRCCRFLLNDRVRAFRNAMAHGNWNYNDDFTGLVFWARKGSDPEEPMVRFEVCQLDLNFWQALARCVAYVTVSVSRREKRMGKWAKLDKQLQDWSPRLRDDLGIGREESNRLATTIASEVDKLPKGALDDVGAGSAVPFKHRVDELKAFQAFMDFVHSATSPGPAIVRAQVILQNYICFVYLGEWFITPRALLPAESTAAKCCVLLTNDPVRAFRNAIAHGNWKYNDDFSGLTFWARERSDSPGPMTRWEVSQLDLGFWQTLARCVAYVTASVLAIEPQIDSKLVN